MVSTCSVPGRTSHLGFTKWRHCPVNSPSHLTAATPPSRLGVSNFVTQLYHYLIHVLPRWSMQINYVIVILAAGQWRTGEKPQLRLQTSSGTQDLFNYRSTKLRCGHHFRVLASSIYSHAYTHTLPHSSDLACLWQALITEQTCLPSSREAKPNEHIIVFTLDKVSCTGW